MAFAALISAYQESSEPGAPLRALLPLAGRTLLERQARLAAAAGADPVIVLVERMPAGLAEAVDRLRRDRIRIQVARGAGEAAALVEGEDRVLLVADGLIAEPALFDRIARAEAPALLTLADAGRDERYERIDAEARWAGLGLIDGALLRATAAMLRDWDPQSTLLRRTVQSGARQLRAEGDLVVADRAGDVAALERQLVEGGGGAPESWARYLLAPVERFAVSRLMDGAVGAGALGGAAVLLTGLGAFAFARELLWLGLLLVLIATPLEGAAERLARLRMQGEGSLGWVRQLLPAAAGAALLALGYARVETDGWGTILLAVTTIAFLLALQFEGEGRALPGRLFLAERRGMAWLMLPFALLGLWTTALFVLFAYAAGSFFWAQHHVHGAPPPRQD